MEVKVKVPQSFSALCDSVDCTVHGILQVRILECIAFSFSRGSSQNKDLTQVSHIAGRFFTSWAIGEALTHGKAFYFFFYFYFIYLFILILNFTILYWFCHISTWIHHRYTRVPHPKPSSLLPPVPSLWVIPVHQPQASSIMHRTWTGDSFHLWYYTCFNAILPNHPTLSLSHRVQKTVLYFSVSFTVSYTGLLLPSF